MSIWALMLWETVKIHIDSLQAALETIMEQPK
jgi:hypothetical protein